METAFFTKALYVQEIINSEVNTFRYIDKEEQIMCIIYYINYIFGYNIDYDMPKYTDFITKVVDNCFEIIENVSIKNNHNSTMTYIDEKLGFETFEMIKSVIKDFYEYFNN